MLKNGLPLIKYVLKPLAENVLITGWTAAASATDAAIHKNMFRSGMTTPIISNEEMNNIMKIVQSFEESVLLIKGVSKTIKNEAKEQKGEFFGMLLVKLGASFLGNLLTGKGNRASEGTSRVGQNF